MNDDVGGYGVMELVFVVRIIGPLFVMQGKMGGSVALHGSAEKNEFVHGPGESGESDR